MRILEKVKSCFKKAKKEAKGEKPGSAGKASGEKVPEAPRKES